MATTTKTHKWADVRRKRTPAEEAQITRAKNAMRATMRLADLRKARRLTQETLAQTMGVAQGEISKIEHRADLYINTLRRFVEAMDGELVLTVTFKTGESTALQLAEEDEPELAHA